MLTSWVYEKPFAWAFLATECEFRTLSFTVLDVAPDLVVLSPRNLH
jgi:hypothetical protein